MNYRGTLRFLYSLQRFGIKLGLHNIRGLLAHLGNPEKSYPSVHIAGTNGKGSTAAILASILQEAGYKVGLYTSPHLVDFKERIRVNGSQIPKKRVIEYVDLLKHNVRIGRCTFFETTTAIAFRHFADEQVDIAVIETGLGGRLDATNVLRPLLSIITNIGLEHTEQLGKTYSSIGREKAGIIKPRTPCLVGEMHGQALRTVARIAKSHRSRMMLASKEGKFAVRKNSLDGIEIDLSTRARKYRRLRVELPGRYQAENARLAVLAAEYLAARNTNLFEIQKTHIREGLRRVSRNTGFRGRLEVIRQHPRIILDVAHNADAINQLVEALSSYQLNIGRIVFGVMRDKNHTGMITSLAKVARYIIAVAPRTGRALHVQKINQAARQAGLTSRSARSVTDGIRMALKGTGPSDTILITGSHYVVGEAIEMLEKIPLRKIERVHL